MNKEFASGVPGPRVGLVYIGKEVRFALFPDRFSYVLCQRQTVPLPTIRQ